MQTSAHSANRSHADLHTHLALKNISVTLGTKQVLKQLDLTVTPTSRIGIVGENGRGKTTLLHVLAGRIEPDAGTVTSHGSIALAEQEMPADTNQTVDDAVNNSIAEAVNALAELEAAGIALATPQPGSEERFATALEHAEALDAWDARRRVELALEALDAETDGERLLTELSVGQRYRVRLACLLGGSDDFLLLDEPTNHLDHAGLEFLTTSLRHRNGGVVLVSHDRALLADVAETILSLDATPDGRPKTYGGGYTGYLARAGAEREQWEQQYAAEQVAHQQLTQDLQAAQDRLISGWRPPKGTGKHQRATRAAATVKNVQRRQDALTQHGLTTPKPPLRLKFPHLDAAPNTPLLTARDVTVSDRLTTPISVSISGGQRLVVTGSNGAGKSTLLNVLTGGLAPTTGSVQQHKAARVGVLAQESQVPARQRVAEYFAQHVQRLMSDGTIVERQAVRLNDLGLFEEAEVELRIAELSMGQQRRLDIALMLARRPNVLVLDEPTNHLSIRLVDELTEALESTRAAVVVATHDRQFLDNTAHWPRLELPTPR